MVFPRSIVWYRMVAWSIVFADTSAASGIGTGSRGYMLQRDVLATISQLLTGEVQPSSSTRCNDSVVNKNMVSERCRLDVCKFEEALEGNERYALEMMDSMGRFPAGLLKGNFQWIGTRTECVRATLDPKSAFSSKYCLTGYDIPLDNETAMSDAISVGICVPESCTEEEVRLLLLDGDLPTPPIGAIGAIFPLSYVYCSYHKSLNAGAIVVICLSVSLLFLVVCGSGYEYYEMKMTQKIEKRIDQNSEQVHSKTDRPASERENQDESTWKELLLSFSAISNGYRILDAKSVDHGEHTMTVLYGFRALTLWWVLLGQTFSINARFMYNFFDIRVILDLIFSQASMNYRYAEDSFFLLSGFLITYYSLTRLYTEGKENWFYFYIHRIWRLSAPYFLAFFGYIYLIEYFCTGPFQRHLHEDLQGCYDHWWSYVLYFNNLYPFPGNINTTCIPWFWFMACLMQFYIISPPIIYLLYRWIHVGIATIAVLIGLCIACTTIIAYHYDMPVSVSQLFNGYLDMSDPATEAVLDDYIETKPYCRMTPYLVGMFLGYLIVKHGKSVKIGRVVSALWWIFTTFVALAIIYGLYWSYQGVELTKTQTLLYHACCKFGYSIAVGWFMYACITGNAVSISRFLSWKFWRPLHRLSFSAYLVHSFAFDMYIKNSDIPVFLSFVNMTYMFVPYLMFSFTVAFFFALVVEKPMMRVEGVLYRKWKSRKTSNFGPPQVVSESANQPEGCVSIVDHAESSSLHDRRDS